ncbi:MAG: SH3 domain-containing protein [Candidatus Wallbacteria bacterium]|nr:SH3 domain-containing protein [Candidatus Wallbacteria bacterium]
MQRFTILILILTVFIAVQGSENQLSQKFTGLKEAGFILDSMNNERGRAEFGSDYDDDFYLGEFFSYLEEMNRQFPDRLDPRQQGYMGQCLDQINEAVTAAASSERPDAQDIAFHQINEVVNRIIHEILLAGSADRGKIAVVSVDSAFVRSGPGKDYDEVCSVKKGVRMPVSDEENSWYKITTPGNRVGWISGKTVTIESGSIDDPDDPPSPSPSNGSAAAIIKSAGGAIGKSSPLYGYTTYNADTEYGRLACAAVVSAILNNADAISCGLMLYCPTFKDYLRDNMGWTTYTSKDYKTGDVIFWRKSTSGDYEETREKHVGVIYKKDSYGSWYTVDNSSVEKEVKCRLLNRPSTYPVNGPCCRPN